MMITFSVLLQDFLIHLKIYFELEIEELQSKTDIMSINLELLSTKISTFSLKKLKKKGDSKKI